jgi:hypothetical protein
VQVGTFYCHHGANIVSESNSLGNLIEKEGKR